MQYRKFGKLEWEVSASGFGAMRLPFTNKDPANVDKLQSIRMNPLCHDIDGGVTTL